MNGNIPGATSPPQVTPTHNQPLNGHHMNGANLRQSPGGPGMNSGNLRQQPKTPEQHANPNDPKFEVQTCNILSLKLYGDIKKGIFSDELQPFEIVLDRYTSHLDL